VGTSISYCEYVRTFLPESLDGVIVFAGDSTTAAAAPFFAQYCICVPAATHGCAIWMTTPMSLFAGTASMTPR